MIRKGRPEDLDRLDQIARAVAMDLHAHGIDQWSAVYPNRDHFLHDWQSDGLYVLVSGKTVLGSVSVLPENDPVYRSIPWKRERSMVIHRMMVDPSRIGKGYGDELMTFAVDLCRKSGCESIKVDTHPDNYRMKGLLRKYGFLPGGYLAEINRDAFELVFGE